MALSIYPGDDVFVDDGAYIIGHVRRSNLREVVVYIEEVGDFTLTRDAVKTADNGRVTLFCKKLDINMRAEIGHLHGEPDPREEMQD